jgi:ankyrin repeat protein
MTRTQDIIAAVRAGNIDKVRKLLSEERELVNAKDETGQSALMVALYHGRRDIADVLLAHNPTLDIFEAAATGKLERLRELLDANPDLLNAYAKDGFYPLGLAAFFGRAEVALYLLERGADVKLVARNPMQVTALHAAVATNQVAIVKALLERGADVNARQQQGWTPLHGAAGEGKLEIMDLLLARGAQLNAKNDEGKTPLAIALERGQSATAEALRKRGGKE